MLVPRVTHFCDPKWVTLFRGAKFCVPLQYKNQKEPENSHSCTAVAVCRSVNGKHIVVGHIPANLSSTLFKFLTLPESSVTLCVTGNRLNRGGGFGMEVPVKARLEGHSKAVAWAKKNIIRLINDHERRVEYCNK